MTHAKTFTVAAIALLGLLVSEYSAAQTVRCTTWNLEWFPNDSAKETPAAQQEQRIKEAADVLRPIDPDIILLQGVRDYDVCRVWAKPSHRAFITSQFALRSRNRSKEH